MTRVLVTGAGGMLGQALTRAAHDGVEVVPRTHGELDIADPGAVAAALHGTGPAVCVNCAAWTDVDAAESQSDAARALNATAAGTLAAACAGAGVRLIQISTDYVFDGAKGRPYVESDAPCPASVYGATKLEGERLVAAASPDHAIVRTSWLFGQGGRNFADTMLVLAEQRTEIAVVTDQVGCPTWTGHLAPALLQIAVTPVSGLVHLAGAGSTSWNGFAREIFDQAHVDCRLLETTTDPAQRPAPRPAYSVLGSERPDTPRLAPWQEGVRGHLASRVAA